jgi:thioesterase domain-containing protein
MKKTVGHSQTVESAEMSAIDHYSQTEASPTPPRAATDEARAALWAQIIGTAKHLRKRDAPVPARQSPVLQLKQGATATPVYFIGAGLFEFHLAGLISSEQAVHAVEITWPSEWHDAAIKNDVDACPSLEELVARYTALIHQNAGTSPCVLIGYSFNGNIAFEAAHQLKTRGTPVERVMLLDCPPEYPVWHLAARRSLAQIWNAPASSTSIAAKFKASTPVARWALVAAVKAVKQNLQWRVMGDPGLLTTKLDTLGRPLHWRLIERLYDHSLRDYQIRRLDSRGVLFRADRAEDCPSPIADESLGWSELFAGGFDIVPTTGDHKSMVEQSPHDQNLARDMSKALDQSYAMLKQATVA